jgi:hypothetical protein
MAFKMNGFSGFKNDERPKLRTSETDRGGRRTIETVSTRVKDEGPAADQFEETVTTKKRGGRIEKIYDSATGTKTKIKYDKHGNIKKKKKRRTSKERIQKLAKKSGTTIKDQVKEIPTLHEMRHLKA